MAIGSTSYRNLDLGATGQVIKASSGYLYGYYIANNATSVRYLKVYDKATAATQADTPILTLPIPPTGAANAVWGDGIPFSAGISVRATTGVADNDTGAPSTNDVIVNLFYR